MVADDARPGRLAGRTVLLIGGGTGIGFEVARRSIAEGARVRLGGRTASTLEQAADRLGEAADWRVVDTAESTSIVHAVEDLERIDAVLTTAATYTVGSFRELDEATAATPFESKLWGQYRVVRAALDRLAPDASIVLMSGAASVRPAGDAPAYVAANAAIEGLARGLAVELAPIRVNAVSPGTIDGHLWHSRPESVREAVFEHYRRESTLARPGTEAEVADAVLHLFTSTFTTGSTLFVDGGYALR